MSPSCPRHVPVISPPCPRHAALAALAALGQSLRPGCGAGCGAGQVKYEGVKDKLGQVVTLRDD